MRYVQITAINNYNRTPWKRGMRIIVTDPATNKHYIATIQRVLGKTLHLIFDNNKKATVESDDPNILGQGVKRKYKGPIPDNKLKLFLTDYRDTRVNNTPELESYGSNPLNYAKALWVYYNTRFFGGKLKKPNFKWTTNNKVLGFFSYDLNNPSKDKYKISNPVVNISRNLANSEEVFRNTVLHEMCHQAVSEIDKETEHYGSSWQKWARRCGISGNSATDVPVIVSDKSGNTSNKDTNKLDIIPNKQIKSGLLCKAKNGNKWIYGVILKINDNKVSLFTKDTILKNTVSIINRNFLYNVDKDEYENLGFTKKKMLQYIASRKRRSRS